MKIAAFLAADVLIVLCAVGIWRWSGLFLDKEQVPTIGLGTILRETMSIGTFPQDAGTPSITDLRYELSGLPEDFRRIEHLQTASASHTYYGSNQAGGIIFNQQVFPEPVDSYDMVAPETIDLMGRQAAFESGEGYNRISWYSGHYRYTLLSDLPRAQLEKVARGSRMAAGPYPTLQRISLEAIPAVYSWNMAKENGDIVLGYGQIAETAKLERFVQNCANKRQDAVRLAIFTDGDGVQLIDLQMDDGRLYCTRDESRDPQSAQPGEIGQEYDELRIEQSEGKDALTLYSSQLDGPLVLVVYENPD